MTSPGSNSIREARHAARILVAGALLLAGVAGQPPPAVASGVKPDAQRLFARALEYKKNEDLSRAAESFLRAYQVDPGVLVLKDGGLMEAIIAHLQKQLENQPDDAALNFKLAEFMNISGRIEAATEYYDRVVALNPAGQLAQTAGFESQRLKDLLAAEAQPPPPPPDPPDAPGDGGGGAGDPGDSTAPPTSATQEQFDVLNGTIENLRKEIATLQEQNRKLQEDHRKLQQEHSDLQEKSRRYKSWQNRYFANPANQGAGGSP